MTQYLTGLQLLQQTQQTQPLSTGSTELDNLIGGIHRSLFYLFYGDDTLINTLYQHLAAHASDTAATAARPLAQTTG